MEKIRFVVCYGLPYISQYVLEKHFNFEQENWAYSFLSQRFVYCVIKANS